MNFIKKNAVLFGLLLGFIVLLAGCVYMLNRQIDLRKAVEADIEQKSTERTQLFERKPAYPSKDNVVAVLKSTEAHVEKINEVLALLLEGTIDVEKIADTKAGDLIAQTNRSLIDLLNRNGIVPPAGRFGFESYDSQLPREVDTPLLQKQLKIIEELVALASSAHVNELVSIRRYELGEAADIAAAAAAKLHNPSTEPLITVGSDFSYIDAPGYLYTSMPFQLEVKCDTGSLREFLIGLSRSKYVLVPRFLKVDNSKKESMNRPSDAANTATKATAAPVVGRGGAVAPNKPNEAVAFDPFQQPFVLGSEMITVVMRIDWLEFRAANAAQPAKKIR